MKIPHVVCYGEVLIDMIAKEVGELKDVNGFLKKFGGAPANTAVGLGKLQIPVSFVGKVGDDPFGHYLKTTLEKYNVQTNSLILSKKDKTTLAFVSLTKTGERDFTFYRGAHETIQPEEINLGDNVFLLHFGSLTQTNETVRKATKKLIDQAQKKKTILSYDPNLRKALWPDLEEAKQIILDTAKQVNILKINQEEAFFLTGAESLEEAATKLFTENLDALFITLGLEGSYFRTKQFHDYVPTIKAKVIDTTGAGDAFNAGYIYALYENQKNPSQMTKHELITAIHRSNVIATLTTTKKGAITAFPKKEELAKILSDNI